VLGATGNVGGRIVQLLIKNRLCKKVVVVTRRKTEAFADRYFVSAQEPTSGHFSPSDRAFFG